MKPAAVASPKYQQVFAALRRDIQSGRLGAGARLPSEAELVRQFKASRITVGRAVRDLQVAGLVERKAGSGTFVKTARASASALSFGLLIPNLGETEIFEPICHGMMASPLAREHALIWGSLHAEGTARDDEAWRLCRQYIDRRVSGVFFAPLELAAGMDVNQRIADALDDARIPVVLLDRPVAPYPLRGHHDLVGIDNRRAGFVITRHLIGLDRRRIAFVGVPQAAATVDAREAGYREALYASGLPIEPGAARRMNPDDTDRVAEWMRATTPDAIVCANDRTAARLMQTLRRLGYAIPEAVALVGIDDADFAGLLPVPLTTLRQPSREIGDAAIAAMLERVARAELPPRDILLHCQLVVRESCGARLPRA